LVNKNNAKLFKNIESSRSFGVVTSGGTWVKARGLKDRKPFTQRVVQQAANVRLHTVVALKVNPFRVYAMGAAFVPLLELPLGLTFWYGLLDYQRLFMKFRDILETTLS
jgi:hypothetical protein